MPLPDWWENVNWTGQDPLRLPKAPPQALLHYRLRPAATFFFLTRHVNIVSAQEAKAMTQKTPVPPMCTFSGSCNLGTLGLIVYEPDSVRAMGKHAAFFVFCHEVAHAFFDTHGQAPYAGYKPLPPEGGALILDDAVKDLSAQRMSVRCKKVELRCDLEALKTILFLCPEEAEACVMEAIAWLKSEQDPFRSLQATHPPAHVRCDKLWGAWCYFSTAMKWNVRVDARCDDIALEMTHLEVLSLLGVKGEDAMREFLEQHRKPDGTISYVYVAELALEKALRLKLKLQAATLGVTGFTVWVRAAVETYPGKKFLPKELRAYSPKQEDAFAWEALYQAAYLK